MSVAVLRYALKFFLYVKCLICDVWEAFSPVLMSSRLLSCFHLTLHPPLAIFHLPSLTFLLLKDYLPLKLTLIPPPRSFLLTQTNQQPLFPGDTEETFVSNYSVIISLFVFYFFCLITKCCYK